MRYKYRGGKKQYRELSRRLFIQGRNSLPRFLRAFLTSEVRCSEYITHHGVFWRVLDSGIYLASWSRVSLAPTRGRHSDKIGVSVPLGIKHFVQYIVLYRVVVFSA